MADLHANMTAALNAPKAAETAPVTKGGEPATPAQKASSEGLKDALGVKDSAPKEKPKAEVKAPPPAEVRKHKLKVDNEELEVDDEELKRGYAHNKAASKRMEEAAAYRKQAEQAFEMLKDPAQLRKILEDPRVGIDLKKFAEDYVWEQMQEQALTPDQKKQREVERELEKYRQAEQQNKTQAEAQEQAQLQERYVAEYEQKIMTALDEGDLPKTRASVRRMAQYLQLAIEHDLDVSPRDLVARVRQDLIDEHKSLYSSGDGNTLLSILGDDLAKKIREADMKRLKSTQPTSQQRAPSQSKPKQPKDKLRGRMSADTIAEALREKLGKG